MFLRQNRGNLATRKYPIIRYLSKSKTRKQEKKAKFTKLSFCQKLIFWHKTSSCKCSMCLYMYYVGKVSDSFIKSSGTSWSPPTIWALTSPLLRSKVSKKWLSSKHSFCQKIFLWHQTFSCKCSMCVHCVCKVSDGFSKSSGTCKLISQCMYYLSTNKTLIKKQCKKNG